jgi:chromosome segregation ATPase
MIVRNALIAVSLALCVLVVAQWTQDSKLRRKLSGMDEKIMVAEATASDLQDKVRMWEAEIARLTENSKTAATREEEQKKEIERLNGILKERDAAQTTSVPDDYAVNLKNLGEEINKRNESITKLNTSIQKVMKERDDFADRLNARTREFNELTAKYNKLAK